MSILKVLILILKGDGNDGEPDARRKLEFEKKGQISIKYQELKLCTIKFYTIIQIFSKFGLVWYDLVWFGLGNLINKSLNQESQSKPYQIIPNQTKLAENLYNSVKSNCTQL